MILKNVLYVMLLHAQNAFKNIVLINAQTAKQINQIFSTIKLIEI